MTQSDKTSRLYEIDGVWLTVMGLKGARDGKNWIMDFDYFKTKEFFWVEVRPEPILVEILHIIEEHTAKGNINKIKYLIISNRVAIRLWFGGVLTSKNFNETIEGRSITPPAQYLFLKEVEIGNLKLSVIILPETATQRSLIVTLDEDFRVVGSKKDERPFFVDDKDWTA